MLNWKKIGFETLRDKTSSILGQIFRNLFYQDLSLESMQNYLFSIFDHHVESSQCKNGLSALKKLYGLPASNDNLDNILAVALTDYY